MSDANALSVPCEFEFEGKVYRVAARNFIAEAAFRKWLETEALCGIQRHRDNYTPEEYQIQLAGFRQDCAVGVYSYPQYLHMQAMSTIEGCKYAAYLALKEHNPEVTQAVVQRIFDDDKAWGLLCEIRKSLDDPNSRKPVQTAPATTSPS